jgi:hypothetical protein
MALGATDPGRPDGWLRCRHSGRQKEEEPRPREAAVYHSDHRSCSWERSEHNKCPRPQGSNSDSCPVHPNSRHSAAECREIIKLTKRVSERHEQSSKDGSPPRRRPGKERANDGEVVAGEWDLGYQSPEGGLKDVFTRDSDSGDDNDRCKKLYVMYGGSWELTSRRNVKSLRREVLSVVPRVPKDAPHQRWRSTTVSFGASDCPDNMARAGVLPLITAPVIANMQLHHVLIDGGAGLNVINHAAFKQLQIPGSRLGPSRPFSGVGPQPVYPLGSIALPVTFGAEENFRTENVLFDVAEVNLPSTPSSADQPCTGSWALPITGIWSSRCRPQPRSSPCVATAPLRLQLWRSCTPWRQRLLARMTEGGTPRPLGPRRLPRCQKCGHLEQTTSLSRSSSSVRVPPRPLALRVIWRRNRNSRLSPSFRQMSTCSHGSHHRCLGTPWR